MDGGEGEGWGAGVVMWMGDEMGLLDVVARDRWSETAYREVARALMRSGCVDLEAGQGDSRAAMKDRVCSSRSEGRVRKPSVVFFQGGFRLVL